MTNDANIPDQDLEPEIIEDGSADPDWAEEARKYKDMYLRGAAEMENMRRRFQKEREDQARFAAERLIKGLLPVVDNLELALAFVKEDAPAEVRGLAEGVRLTLKGLNDLLADNGVTPVAADRGQLFDPNLHEALGQISDENLPPGAISQPIQKGYNLHDRLVRPAKVMVAKAI
ncbi:MAG: nucleotide exchange factor GrpE [Candidatus Adiutrix sp.]|jgi:molecular chaperone GrpE|nr:nucleotide exchange factor GrpE [Candidatus Adiutrix sp.]